MGTYTPQQSAARYAALRLGKTIKRDANHAPDLVMYREPVGPLRGDEDHDVLVGIAPRTAVITRPVVLTSGRRIRTLDEAAAHLEQAGVANWVETANAFDMEWDRATTERYGRS